MSAFRHQNFQRLTLACIASIASLWIAGCATKPTAPSLAENKAYWQEQAMQRANLRWAHIRAKRYGEAYAMYTQASRKDFTPEMLARTIQNIRANDGKVDRAECTDEKCEVWVNVELTFKIPRVGNKQQIVPFAEQWVPEEGEIRLLRPQ
jgi:hypothetical protein